MRRKLPEWICGNLFLRPNYLEKAGDKVDGHTHNFDHMTVVWEGRVKVNAVFPDGRTMTQEFGRSEHFLVKAEVAHEIIALEDNTMFMCIYAHRDAQGQVTQKHEGWMDAYR